MARIRSSKPEWWKSAKWCHLSRDVRSTYKGIWEVMCDDDGRFLADPRQVKADVWPLDDDITPKKLTTWLSKLAEVEITLPDNMGGGKAPAIQFYVVDGIRYGYLAGFVEHQKISHPGPSKLPKPPSIERKDSGPVPEPLPNDSGDVPEKFRPDVDVDVDVDVDRDIDKSGEEAKTAANGTSPRVVLPREAENFLAQFYEPAFTETARKRYNDVKRQLYDVIDPKHPGPKIRGGRRVKARSVEHLVETLKGVMKDPPPNRDHAILWVLNKLLDPPKGPSVTEVQKRQDEETRQLEERYFVQAKRAGIQWANEHPDDYQRIIAEVNAHYNGQTSSFAKIGKESELTQKCADAADFPSFETWAESQAVPA